MISFGKKSHNVDLLNFYMASWIFWIFYSNCSPVIQMIGSFLMIFLEEKTPNFFIGRALMKILFFLKVLEHSWVMLQYLQSICLHSLSYCKHGQASILHLLFLHLHPSYTSLKFRSRIFLGFN